MPRSSISRQRNRATRLSPQNQYLAATLVLFLVLFGGSLPTPLYPVWQQKFGLSTSTITGVYAVYPAGVVLGLLLVEGWRTRSGDGRLWRSQLLRAFLLNHVSLGPLASVYFSLDGS